MLCIVNLKSEQLIKLFIMLQSRLVQNFRIFGAKEGTILNLQVSISFGKFEKRLNRWSPPVSGRVRTVALKPRRAQQWSPPHCCTHGFTPPPHVYRDSATALLPPPYPCVVRREGKMPSSFLMQTVPLYRPVQIVALPLFPTHSSTAMPPTSTASRDYKRCMPHRGFPLSATIASAPPLSSSAPHYTTRTSPVPTSSNHSQTPSTPIEASRRQGVPLRPHR
jgi:hypothetical protein